MSKERIVRGLQSRRSEIVSLTPPQGVGQKIIWFMRQASHAYDAGLASALTTPSEPAGQPADVRNLGFQSEETPSDLGGSGAEGTATVSGDGAHFTESRTEV